jgi:tetratricopeptide (TPR) repeat protein
MLRPAFADDTAHTMTDADDINNLQQQLAAHRHTLAVYLRQLASLGADHAPPRVHNGITEARAEIARLKVALRDVGVVVQDQVGDEASVAGEEIGSARAPVIASAHAERDVNIATHQNIFNISHPHPQPRPVIDPDEALQRLDRLPLDEIPDAADLPPSSRMQLRRNPLFVGREEDLKAIAKNLKDGRAAAITTGIGGVGKTQLTSEFAYRYGQFFAGGVFWLSFADPAGIDSEIAACGGAGALELYTDAAGLSQAEQVAKVYAEWALPIPRLLIFDNCDDLPGTTAEALLTQRMPRSGGCRVLVTSRRGQWRKGLGIAALPLGVLSRAESIALLRSHRDDIGDDDADAIAVELGDLPLALSLAGGYLEAYRDEAFGTPATYLANLRTQLLAHRSMQGASAGPSLIGHELNVRATFALSYERLDAADSVDALAIMALARAAHLAPGEPFPRELLLATLGDEIEDEEIAAQRGDALGRLVVLGLLELAEGSALRIHRLIAIFAQAMSEDAEAQAVVEDALSRSAYQINEAGYPAAMEPILAHLRHATEVAAGRVDQRAATLTSNLGLYFQKIADYAGAQPLLEWALQISEKMLGPQHLDTATSLNNLAELLRLQGDYANARLLFERALTVIEQELGPEHHRTASSINNLALLMQEQGDYIGAKTLFERALVITKQALGTTHPDTAQSLNNLAGVLQNLGDYTEARSLYEEVLAIYEQVREPDHPDIALSLNNLAYLLRIQGDYARAKPLYERALEIYEQVLGSHHPDTAMVLGNLAYLLQSQSDYAGAKPLFERALAIYKSRLGTDHPDTQTVRRNLVALNLLLSSTAQQIADITTQAEVAVAAALADPTIDRIALAAQIEATAQQVDAAGLPYLALATHLRTLAAQLTAPPADEPVPDNA